MPGLNREQVTTVVTTIASALMAAAITDGIIAGMHDGHLTSENISAGLVVTLNLFVGGLGALSGFAITGGFSGVFRACQNNTEGSASLLNHTEAAAVH